jgi:hypothetical protein
MTSSQDKVFLTHYLGSLKERTREEKGGAKWGLDWVIYNLGLATKGRPIRLPFLRTTEAEYAKTKTEPEFGVDLSFLSSDGKDLTVFALKDEPLTYKNWDSHDFQSDLKRAQDPDLTAEGLEEVKVVTIVLAYNKDDDAAGITCYERLVNSASNTLKDGVKLKFERWNLSIIVDRVAAFIFSPALLPQKFYGQLTYICHQAAEFRHGSDQWVGQLLPAWGRLVDDILESRNPSAIELIPVVLSIIRQEAAQNPSIETGMIDLTEIAALRLWRCYLEPTWKKSREGVIRFWYQFYMGDLQRFYVENIAALSTQHSIGQPFIGSYVGSAAASYIAYWHLGRIGILATCMQEISSDETPDKAQAHRDLMREIEQWIVHLTNANPSVYRPMLDSHHIQIFLIWAIFVNAGMLNLFVDFLSELINRLWIRKNRPIELPFLDGRNSWQTVFEEISTRPDDPLIINQSSFLILMLMELACSLPSKQGDSALTTIYHAIVASDSKDTKNENKALDLISWIPPADWAKKILSGPVEDGECVTISNLVNIDQADPATIRDALTHLCSEMRKVTPELEPTPTPVSALILGCLRNNSPIPPEFWRRSIFPQDDENITVEKSDGTAAI